MWGKNESDSLIITYETLWCNEFAYIVYMLCSFISTHFSLYVYNKLPITYKLSLLALKVCRTCHFRKTEAKLRRTKRWEGFLGLFFILSPKSNPWGGFLETNRSLNSGKIYKVLSYYWRGHGPIKCSAKKVFHHLIHWGNLDIPYCFLGE